MAKLGREMFSVCSVLGGDLSCAEGAFEWLYGMVKCKCVTSVWLENRRAHEKT